MEDAFRFADDLGPAQISFLYNSAAGLKAIVVVDNVAAGPSIGGARMAPDVTLEECFRLARTMTLKNAAASLPHGGSKSVIFADPAMPQPEKERLIRAFACAIGDMRDYIVGPDMGTDETCMAWIKDEIGRSVGLPRVIGGIPLDQIGATGLGLAIVAEVAEGFCDVKLQGARVAVQGFGAVGKHVARFLAERGARLVAAADSRATIVDSDGLDVAALIALKEEGKHLGEQPNVKVLDRDAIVGVDCDIWIPAARPDVLTADNAGELKARLVIQGANIPATEEAERIMHDKGILSVPDFIANAGGVICASVEYHGGAQPQAFAAIEEKIRFNTEAVLKQARKSGVLPRAAAKALAEERVRAAMALRRWG
jgi:glutamate dehydrogenase (NAD(P)+)